MFGVAEFYADLRDAASSLRRRPGRSLLSGLGIAIGVVALVSMVSISEGARREALRRIASLGVDTIRIEPAAPGAEYAGADVANLSQGITVADTRRLSAWLGERGVLGYYVRRDRLLVRAAQRSAVATMIGTSADWMDAERLALAGGRLLLPADAAAQRRVCLLGAVLASELRVRPGALLHAAAEPCLVVGVLRPRGRLLTEGTGLASLDFDRLLVTPYAAFPFPDTAERGVLDSVVVRTRGEDEELLRRVAANVDALLRAAHRNVRDYRLVIPRALLDEARQTQRLFQLVMGSIAGLSLLVGGIGVMNIMLANISEQTREIGLRMALGASRRRIVSLYLCHSLLLCLAGGVLGLAAGVLAALAIQAWAGWAVAFSGPALLLGPASAALAGLLFGLHPAARAAALDPAIALREA